MTYAFASRLPTIALDFLLLLPHRLAILRESLQSAREISSPPTPAPAPKPPASVTSSAPSGSQRTDAAPTPSESEAESSTYTSEADGEASTNPSYAPTRANTIADSWVSVKDDE